MNLLGKFLNRTEFKDYEDFKSAQLIAPKNFNFGFDVVDEYASVAPTKRALVWCNSSGDERIFNFKQLSDLSNQAVNFFIHSGLKSGDYVMTMLNRRWEYWVVAVACHKLGLVIIPATHLLTPKDISYRCNSADVKMLIATAEDDVVEHITIALPKCEKLQKCIYTKSINGSKSFEDLISVESEILPSDIRRPNAMDNMLCYFTSGTTGMPKMVQHNFEYPLGHIFTAYFWQQVKDDGLHFTMAESGWAKCSWGKIYGQWIAGSAVFAYDYHGRFTPTDIIPLIEKYKITTFCAPPTIYRFLIKEDLSHYNFSSLTHCSTAGEALNAEIFKQFYEATGQKIYEGFGQTESTVLLATFSFMEPISGSLGKPSPIYDIELIDDDENPVPDGCEGEISVKLREHQYGLVSNYKNEPERTALARGGKYYHTGDLAMRDSNGIFWFVGRKDDIIKSSGYRIGPFEIESVLMEHPSVLECAITGVPDPLRGQIVKATIVLAKGYTPSEELKHDLQDYVKRVTAPYKYPRIIEFVQEMPKTTSGKIRRVEIRNNDKTNK
ncbi:MAG: AMP-binding protein [Clostridia bacterium]